MKPSDCEAMEREKEEFKDLKVVEHTSKGVLKTFDTSNSVNIGSIVYVEGETELGKVVKFINSDGEEKDQKAVVMVGNEEKTVLRS